MRRKELYGERLTLGQTCIAPDYVIVHENVKGEFLECCKNAINKFYGEKVIDSPDYGRVVNERHFDRLRNLEGQNVLVGGKLNKQKLFIEPTLIKERLEFVSMSEEIFRLILPIFSFSKLEDVFEITDKFKNPLALYVFSNDKSVQKEVFRRITSGGACINDTLVHISNLNLPFGGVGQSGIGLPWKRKLFYFRHQGQ